MILTGSIKQLRQENILPLRWMSNLVASQIKQMISVKILWELSTVGMNILSLQIDWIQRTWSKYPFFEIQCFIVCAI